MLNTSNEDLLPNIRDFMQSLISICGFGGFGVYFIFVRQLMFSLLIKHYSAQEYDKSSAELNIIITCLRLVLAECYFWALIYLFFSLKIAYNDLNERGKIVLTVEHPRIRPMGLILGGFIFFIICLSNPIILNV